jgi:hypothetical protein
MHNDDVNLKGIAAFLGILAVTLVVVYMVITAMSRHLEKNARQADAQTSPLSGGAYFPAPREQPNPLVDLETLRASEDAELNSYGWIDKTNGVVRIPIDRAIDLLTQRQGGQP